MSGWAVSTLEPRFLDTPEIKRIVSLRIGISSLFPLPDLIPCLPFEFGCPRVSRTRSNSFRVVSKRKGFSRLLTKNFYSNVKINVNMCLRDPVLGNGDSERDIETEVSVYYLGTGRMECPPII